VTKTLAYSNAEQITGLGKSTHTFSAERRQISAPRQASVGGATWLESGVWKSADVRRKMYMLIYPDPQITTARCFTVQDQDNGGTLSLKNKHVFSKVTFFNFESQKLF